MTKGGKLDVWRKKAVRLGTGQRYHMRELLIYWLVLHVLESNPTRLSVMGRDCGLNHREEGEFVIVFALHNTTNKPHPD